MRVPDAIDIPIWAVLTVSDVRAGDCVREDRKEVCRSDTWPNLTHSAFAIV